MHTHSHLPFPSPTPPSRGSNHKPQVCFEKHKVGLRKLPSGKCISSLPYPPIGPLPTSWHLAVGAEALSGVGALASSTTRSCPGFPEGSEMPSTPLPPPKRVSSLVYAVTFRKHVWILRLPPRGTPHVGHQCAWERNRHEHPVHRACHTHAPTLGRAAATLPAG